MKKIFFSLLCMAIGLSAFSADSTEVNVEQINAYLQLADSLNKVLKWQTGVINLPGNHSTLNVPKGFKYLDAAQSQYIVSDLWGNPKDETILGMIYPEQYGVLDDSAWAFIVSFQDIGFVKDDDADDIDYDDLLKQMREDFIKDNENRKTLGLSSLYLVGWAQPPFYDKNNKVLHWAKELKSDDGGHTLNYDIRILGRKGVLSLNAVSSMEMLPSVKKNIDAALKMASFTDGNTYKDFDPKVDEVAAWTIGGLIAGKILLKAGLLAGLGKFFLVAWKFILIGLAACWGFIKKLFTKKKQEDGMEEVVADTPTDTE